MSADLPVGTYVHVQPNWPADAKPFCGRITGHDMFRSKYKVASRITGWDEWMWADGIWAFPGEVREVTEAEATALPPARAIAATLRELENSYQQSPGFSRD